MKYLKLFERDEDAIYNRTSDTLYDAPGVAYIKDVDKVIYAPFDLNQKYYIDENYNAVLYRESYIDIVNKSETINISGISSPIVKTINFTFENITTDNIGIVLSSTSNIISSEIILDGNSGSFDIIYTPVNYGTTSVQIYLRSYSSKNPEELVSSNIVTFNYVAEEELDYLTITMLDDGIFSIRDNVTPGISNEGIAPLNLKYSINKGEWQTYDINTEINLKANDNIRLKGNNEYFSLLTENDENDENTENDENDVLFNYNYTRVFNIKGYYNLSGHLISLLSEDLQYNKELPSGCFKHAFQDYFKLLDFNEGEIHINDREWLKENLKGVVDASKLILPESLSTYIYAGMFYFCPNLTVAPKLPAKTLAEGCYNGMFYICISLITAPELPAKTLTEGCYNSMFSNCTSLEEAPELPATTLATSCYADMFEGCRSLTTAPELPVMELTDRCYCNMFYDCTSLTEAPELPATTLADYCYSGMFYNCTNLTEAPALPAETLAERCYSDMFRYCTSLETINEISATTLADRCCLFMFEGCTSLVTVPKLKATILAPRCYSSMFKDCTNLTIAPEISATTLAERCCTDMFYNCINLTTVPELPAETLTDECYEKMFCNCTKLNYIKVGFTDWNDDYDYLYEIPTYMWVDNVASEGIFICPEELTIKRGFAYIPEGWVVPSKGSIVISNKETLETPITVQTNITQSFTINVDLQQLTLENCSVTSSNSKFIIGAKENNSIVVNFKSTTSGTFTSTIIISDNTYNTGKSDSVVLTVNVPEPEKSYYLRYGNSDNYNNWINEVEGIEQTNGDIVFEPLNFTTNNNFIALTTKENDTSLSTNVKISNFTGSHDGSVQDMSGQPWGGKDEYRISVVLDGDYTIILNLTNKTIYVKPAQKHTGGSND